MMSIIHPRIPGVKTPGNRMRAGMLLALLGIAIQTGHAQSVLDSYITIGLDNNLALKQKETNHKRSVEALREAKGLFFPNITLNARYSVAEGGRTIDLPIGDLLNPVYSTLNQILRENRFPAIDNQSFMFLRPKEQETKIRIIQPVFNTDVYYNAAIKRELVQAEQISVDQYRQELVAEIRKAWYQLGLTNRLEALLRETRKLLEENLRVNEKLLENGKITIDHVYRARTELARFDQQQLVAAKSGEIAIAYFNFLLNRPLQEPVRFEEPTTLPDAITSSDSTAESAIRNRQELKKLEKYDQITGLQVKMNRAAALPNLMIVADYGIQGEEYSFNKDADFGQASAVLSWDLFAGYQNRARIKQARLQKEQLKQQTEEVRQQIRLQVVTASADLNSCLAAIESAVSQAGTAREGFRLVKRRYEEGQASLIEFMDARTTLTQAEENLILTRYAYLISFAEFEKVCALSTF
jgi:outer membrane protein TolC